MAFGSDRTIGAGRSYVVGMDLAGTTFRRQLARAARHAVAQQVRTQRRLEQRGLYVLGVSPAAPLGLARLGRLGRAGLGLPTSLRRRIALKALLLVNQEFHALVRAGLPIVQALDVLVRQCRHRRLREALAAIREDVTGGLAFSDAAAKHPRLFSHLYVASLRAGERSGTFVECLGRYLSRHAGHPFRVIAGKATYSEW